MATGFAFGGPDEQRGMLAAEGIAFDEEGRVLMEEFQWDGRPESAAPGENDMAHRRRPRTSTGKPNWPSTRCTIARPARRRRPDCKKERHA